MKKHPSPLKSIRNHCLDCCLNQSAEVRHCGASGCPSHPLRFGKSAPGNRPLQTIKKHCTECSGDERPKDCEEKDCALFPFRLKKNPNRKGIGNHSPDQTNLRQNARTKHVSKGQKQGDPTGCSNKKTCGNCTYSDRGQA